MTNICQYDSNMIFTGDTFPHDEQFSIPRGWVAAEPPEGTGIFKWAGSAWQKLEKYPEPPPAPEAPAKMYDPDKLILLVDGMGKLEELAKMLNQSPLRVQLRWQKATQFNGADADFIGTIKAIQTAWKLSDEQVIEILKQCEV